MRVGTTGRSGFRRTLRYLIPGVLVGALALGVAGALTSGPARAVTQAAPKNTAEPSISGTATQGATLTTSHGDWSGTSPMTFAYQWVRCPTSGGKPDGSDCAAISGATTSAYVVGTADVGKRLRVRVTASNADGSATVASNPTATVTAATGKPPKAAKAPSITGTPSPGSTLHGDPGTWSGVQPITFSFQWVRCDPVGNNCVELAGQRDSAYTLKDSDTGHTMRFRVTARNAAGQRTSVSAPTALVSSTAGLPPGAIKLPNGETSIPATSVPSSERLVVDQVAFSPSTVRSRTTPITIGIKIKDTRGYVVRDALVFVRSTPLVTGTPAEQPTATDGTITYTVQPESDFPLRNGYNVQFFIKAHRTGDKALAGIAGYRLVQVATAAS